MANELFIGEVIHHQAGSCCFFLCHVVQVGCLKQRHIRVKGIDVRLIWVGCRLCTRLELLLQSIQVLVRRMVICAGSPDALPWGTPR